MFIIVKRPSLGRGPGLNGHEPTFLFTCQWLLIHNIYCIHRITKLQNIYEKGYLHVFVLSHIYSQLT